MNFGKTRNILSMSDWHDWSHEGVLSAGMPLQTDSFFSGIIHFLAKIIIYPI